MAAMITKDRVPYFVSITILILMVVIYSRFQLIKTFIAELKHTPIYETLNQNLQGQFTIKDKHGDKKGEIHIFRLDHPSPNIKSYLMGYNVEISNRRAHKNAQGFFVLSPWEGESTLVEWYTIDHMFTPLGRTFNMAERQRGGEFIFNENHSVISGISQAAINIFHKYQGDSLEVRMDTDCSTIRATEMISREVFFLERKGK
jgi:hypothetical protein